MQEIRTHGDRRPALGGLAVSTLQEAQKVTDRLADAGYRAYLTRRAEGSVDMYRVRVGPFETRRQAEDVAERLERDGYQSLWITK